MREPGPVLRAPSLDEGGSRVSGRTSGRKPRDGGRERPLRDGRSTPSAGRRSYPNTLYKYRTTPSLFILWGLPPTGSPPVEVSPGRLERISGAMELVSPRLGGVLSGFDIPRLYRPARLLSPGRREGGAEERIHEGALWRISLATASTGRRGRRFRQPAEGEPPPGGIRAGPTGLPRGRIARSRCCARTKRRRRAVRGREESGGAGKAPLRWRSTEGGGRCFLPGPHGAD